jgi:hypothetical protein
VFFFFFLRFCETGFAISKIEGFREWRVETVVKNVFYNVTDKNIQYLDKEHDLMDFDENIFNSFDDT